MDTLQKLFEYIPSALGLLVAWLVFLGGIIVGFSVGWPIRKLFALLRKKRDKELDEVITSLQLELRKLDAGVGELWTVWFPPSRRRIPIGDIKTQPNGGTATANIINARIALETLGANIASISHSLKFPHAEESQPARELHVSPQRREAVSRDSLAGQEISSSPAEESHRSSSSPTFNSAEAVIEFYNRAVSDPIARDLFRENYSPLRIGTVNAVERRQNPTIKPEIKETTDGDFFALPLERVNEFAVFPRLGLTIEAISFTAGAMGEVFDKTRGHDPKLFYSRYRVKEPAIFRLEGDRWQLREPGELELGVGEQ